MNARRARSTRGFTLIEVLVAVLVVALGIGALLTTLSSSADTIGRLRDKSFAQWIALNQIATLRLATTKPTTGTTTGDLDYANTHWRWQQQVTDQGVAGILRVEVRVAPGTASMGTADDATFPAVGTAYGFIGSAVMRSSGIDPDWSLAGAAPRGGAGGAPPPVVAPP